MLEQCSGEELIWLIYFTKPLTRDHHHCFLRQLNTIGVPWFMEEYYKEDCLTEDTI